MTSTAQQTHPGPDLAPGGTIVLGEPGRQTGELFPNWIRARGWSLRSTDEPVITRPRPVTVFELSRDPPWGPQNKCIDTSADSS